MNERKIAVEILYEIFQNDAYVNIALSKTFKKYANLSSDKKGLITEIIFGVTERKLTLDYIISQFSSVKINKISLNILNVLRSGIYQLLFLDKIPVSASVNESVKLAKAFGGQRSAGFVNAILRNIDRNRQNISYPQDKSTFLSVYYSYPIDLINLFVSKFGYNFTEELLKAYSQRKPLTIRCNTLKTTPEKLIEELISNGIDAVSYVNKQFESLDYALQVKKIKNIEKLKSFTDGKFYVQDVAAMLVTEVLAPKAGDIVIDVCAAPGGKTTHIAEKMQNKGQIIAFDIYEHKIKLINENLQRLGITICDTLRADAAILNPEYIQTADCVLVDAPCSGLGIIGKKPDIKYQRVISDIEALSDISYSILVNASKYVKSGGTLVFSTCTIIDTENEMVVNRFLKENGNEFYLEQIKDINIKNQGYITLYPHINNIDGFFICKFKKR